LYFGSSDKSQNVAGVFFWGLFCVLRSRPSLSGAHRLQRWNPVGDPDPQEKSDCILELGGPWRQDPRLAGSWPISIEILSWGRTLESFESFASRAVGNGARSRNLRAESSRNQVSILILVHKPAISRATPVGAPRRGHQSGPESGQGTTSVLQKHYREPLSLTLLGEKGDKYANHIFRFQISKDTQTIHRTSQHHSAVAAGISIFVFVRRYFCILGHLTNLKMWLAYFFGPISHSPLQALPVWGA
jgi:hypothetical protein